MVVFFESTGLRASSGHSKARNITNLQRIWDVLHYTFHAKVVYLKHLLVFGLPVVIENHAYGEFCDEAVLLFPTIQSLRFNECGW